MKTLIVEDDDLSREKLTTLLTKEGCEVFIASDGNEAWKILNENPVHLVLSDWHMPYLDGLMLCKKIRELSRKEYIYFILLTASSGEENYQNALDCGVDDFLVKPAKTAELLGRLRVAKRIINFISDIHQLKELLPICMYCKKIRNDDNFWEKVEIYMRKHTGMDFSHGICPECFEKYTKELNAEALKYKDQK